MDNTNRLALILYDLYRKSSSPCLQCPFHRTFLALAPSSTSIPWKDFLGINVLLRKDICPSYWDWTIGKPNRRVFHYCVVERYMLSDSHDIEHSPIFNADPATELEELPRTRAQISSLAMERSVILSALIPRLIISNAISHYGYVFAKLSTRSEFLT